MKWSLSWSSILISLALAILLAALPGAIRRLVRTGDPYLFTRDFFDDLWARLRGPGRLGFILQPSTALLVGLRDGKRDVGHPPFLSALAFHEGRRLNLLRNAFTSIGDLVAIAVILDVISQFLIFREIHPGAALLVGPVLIAGPYSLSRALANRIARGRAQQATAGRPD